MYPENKYWTPLVNFLKEKKLEDQIFIGPEVLLYEFPNVFPYQILKDIDLNDYHFEYIIFHKKLPEDLTNEYLDLIQSEYQPVWANHLFVVYKKHRSRTEKLKALKYIFYSKINFSKYYKIENKSKTGLLITTYNRPERLRKLLEQLQDRTEEILVINDGSATEFADSYQKIKLDFPNISYITNPKNMGLVFSLNTGFSYFLSDPDLGWIHYIQDDVVLEKDFFDIIDKVKDKDNYPVVAGIYRKPHKIFGQKTINGVDIYLLRSAPAQHLLLHRKYLQKNLPIPNPYIGAPKNDAGKPGQGTDADWWLLSWSPYSLVKNGKFIACIPNLASTDAYGNESTWDY